MKYCFRSYAYGRKNLYKFEESPIAIYNLTKHTAVIANYNDFKYFQNPEAHVYTWTIWNEIRRSYLDYSGPREKLRVLEFYGDLL
jgi:hypothetical protein